MNLNKIRCFSKVSTFLPVGSIFFDESTIFSESFIVDTAFDGICLGEGEQALLELIDRIEIKDYPKRR